jgi:protein associated with RNAse G/E
MSAQHRVDQGLSPSQPTEPGTVVGGRMRKWDGTEHWRFDGTYLGRDGHGLWVGYRTGTLFSRPGRQFRSKNPGLVLFGDVGWVADIYRGHPRGARLYIDLTTVPEWRAVPDAGDGPAFEVSAVDLDLDVLAQEPGTKQARTRGESFIDDEDEFAEHTVRYGYPPSVVARVRADADGLLAAVRAGEPPYDGATATRWFAVLDAL